MTLRGDDIYYEDMECHIIKWLLYIEQVEWIEGLNLVNQNTTIYKVYIGLCIPTHNAVVVQQRIEWVECVYLLTTHPPFVDKQLNQQHHHMITL